LFLGGINIADHSIRIGDANILWGAFLQSVIDFAIVSFSIFLMVKFFDFIHRWNVSLKHL